MWNKIVINEVHLLWLTLQKLIDWLIDWSFYNERQDCWYNYTLTPILHYLQPISRLLTKICHLPTHPHIDGEGISTTRNPFAGCLSIAYSNCSWRYLGVRLTKRLVGYNRKLRQTRQQRQREKHKTKSFTSLAMVRPLAINFVYFFVGIALLTHEKTKTLWKT